MTIHGITNCASKIEISGTGRFEDLALDLTENVFAPSDLHDGPRARLDDPHLLVLAAGGQQAAVGVEGHAEDDVGVAVDHLHRLPDLQVPDQDLSQLEKQQAGSCCAEID